MQQDKVMTYKHGNWHCKPASEEEAREIVERAMASGAIHTHAWKGSATRFQYGVINGRVEYGELDGTEYTIEELREKFPLPGDKVKDSWDDKGLPPIGGECEYSITGSKYKTCTFVGINSRKSIVIENESGELLTYHSHQIKFRPLHSKREQWIEAAAVFAHKDAVLTPEQSKHAAGAIYEALKSGDLKAPKVK